MKLLTKSNIKKIILLIIVILIFNMIMPLHRVSASTLETIGGIIFEPICKFCLLLGDLILGTLRELMLDGSSYTYYGPALIFSNKVPALDTNFVSPSADSIASDLQSFIATWYKALRTVALVGLLSVLVYIGIRMIMSSTAQEKTKYKKMVTDWVVAICILFMLHYIMSFVMSITEQITNILSVNIIDESGDTLIKTVSIGAGSSSYVAFGRLVIYLVLVFYSVIFTVKYLKRVVYLAFFTMIAPLIALTYPLDKIKDGQAQAFNMWCKEYVFNALIPVIHIVIYSALVGSAIELATSNPIYAIVCIAFLTPAEKFIRKMFGFDKASTVSPAGAVAGTALAMNAMNKITHMGKGPHRDKEGGKNSGLATARTASGNGLTIGGASQIPEQTQEQTQNGNSNYKTEPSSWSSDGENLNYEKLPVTSEWGKNQEISSPLNGYSNRRNIFSNLSEYQSITTT